MIKAYFNFCHVFSHFTQDEFYSKKTSSSIKSLKFSQAEKNQEEFSV